MGEVFRKAVSILTRLIVSLRYRIKFHGWQQIRDLKRPVLLLPNHPAFIDPVLILATFYGTFRPRIVVYEGNFSPFVRLLLVKWFRAILLPDLQHPSHDASERTASAIAEVIAALHRQESCVLWPSGRAQRDGVERLGAARALTEILQAVPEISLVLIRTRGVWGSMFSFARTGQIPQLGRCLTLSGFWLLANLLIFMPRRDVDITVEAVDRNHLPNLERTTVNRWYEAWSNHPGPEIPTYVPYHFLLGPQAFEFPATYTSNQADGTSESIRVETKQALSEILAEFLHRTPTPAELEPGTNLTELNLDSLQRMELALAVERRFGCSIETTPETLGQLMAMAQGTVGKTRVSAPSEWFRDPANVTPLKIMGETIPEAFIARTLSTPHDIAAADDLSGAITYERLLIGALLAARRFSRLAEPNLGLMLPASVASDIMLLGFYFADKLPVMLNWTTGPANLQHAVQLTDIKSVITSRQLRDRLNITIPGVEFLDVEDLHKQFRWAEKLRAFLEVRFLSSALRRRLPTPQPDSNAVILFTSGSEKAPKAVPLTHRNIISNVQIVPAVLKLTTKDVILGFLPMFHSFGFTMTSLFPLLGGIRVVHHPDPTDTAGLNRKIFAYRPTVLVGIPSLIAHLFERAHPGDLDSLKLIVVGAEKCPLTLYDRVRQVAPQVELIEGYGVTECSPAIAGNRPGANHPGTLGRPLPGVEICIVDLQTGELLPSGEMGMLLVNGPSVFSGYLGDEQSPFVDREGKRWYVTGDLAVLDAEGYLHFSGRLKRFLKAGGEMISLPALEEPFLVRYPPDDNGPRIAVEGVELESGSHIVLFTTESITHAEANRLLAEQGFHGVMHLDEVRHLDRIPILGAGKINYQKLRSMITPKVEGQ